jgi:16S rRNA (guanine527-N7)-methyltransferase
MAHKNQTNWSPYKAGLGNPKNGSKPRPSGQGGEPAPKVERHRKSTETFSFNEADDRMFDIFRNHGFDDFPHEKRQQLTRFYQLLMDNQNERNFTRLLTLRDVAIKHFIDSLMPARLTKLAFPLLDMGTGPGFPGIPLKIEYPKETIMLAEGVQKRVEFLKHARAELGLKKLPIVGRNVNVEFFYPMRGVITRAVEDARNTLGNTVNCVQTGGFVYLMKGPNCTPEIQMALDKWGEYFKLEKDIAYELPKSPHQRRLLIFKKIKPHPLPDFEELDLAWERENGREG